MDRNPLPNPSSRLATSTIDTTKHSFAIRPFVPAKKRTANSHSTSPLINKSEDQRTNNGSKSLRNKKQLLISERNKQSQAIEIRSQLLRTQDNLKNLKKLYKKLKQQYDSKEETTKQIITQNIKLSQQLDETRQQGSFYFNELQRIKKECLKLLEIEGFKNKKMEQTLQQKELMIQYLKNQLNTPKLSLDPNNFLSAHTPQIPDILNPLLPNNNYNTTTNYNNNNLSLASLQDILSIEAHQKDKFINSISQKDRDDSNMSLNFSKDKSKFMFDVINDSEPVLPSPSFQQQRKLSMIHHHHSSVGSFENISFSMNQPHQYKQNLHQYNKQKQIHHSNKIKQIQQQKQKQKQKCKGFKKNKILQINTEDIATIEDNRDKKRQSCTAKTKRRKSETDDKISYEMSVRSKYDSMIQKRLGTSYIR